MELCGWGRYLATAYTFGAPVPGAYMPDLERAGCILFWGYNPSLARIVHATAPSPRSSAGRGSSSSIPAGSGCTAPTQWLRVRPGTDTALALSIAHVMIERGWFDRDFVRDWTNGPLLVRDDNGRLLRERRHRLLRRRRPLRRAGTPRAASRWPSTRSAAATMPTRSSRLSAASTSPRRRALSCRPVFDASRRALPPLRARRRPKRSPASTPARSRRRRSCSGSRGPSPTTRGAASSSTPNATQMARAIAQLCVLTGSLDVPAATCSSPRAGGPDRRRRAAFDGAARQGARPRRPAARAVALQIVTSGEVYDAALEAQPYTVRGVVGFGANW